MAKTKALTKREPLTFESAIKQISPEARALLKRTIAVGATDDELSLFIYDCLRRGVNPMDKMIHFIKYSGNPVHIASIDLFRSQAEDSGQYAGQDKPIFEEDEQGNLISATVTVYRYGRNNEKYGVSATAYMKEFRPAPGKDFMWIKMPHSQLAKCAEAQALRKCFPKKLGSLYTGDEMEQANSNKTVITIPPLPDSTKNNDKNGIERKRLQMYAMISELKIPKEQAKMLIADMFGKPHSTDMTLDEIETFIFCLEGLKNKTHQIEVINGKTLITAIDEITEDKIAQTEKTENQKPKQPKENLF